MAVENYGLREMVIAAVGDVVTTYLHTENPGVNGTTGRVPVSALPSVAIPAGTTGWNIDGTLGRATVLTDLAFGNALEAITGVSWVSMFKGANFWAKRELVVAMDVDLGAPVTVTASTIVINVTSTD